MMLWSEICKKTKKTKNKYKILITRPRVCNFPNRNRHKTKVGQFQGAVVRRLKSHRLNTPDLNLCLLHFVINAPLFLNYLFSVSVSASSSNVLSNSSLCLHCCQIKLSSFFILSSVFFSSISTHFSIKQ